ncbi:MAG: hypothetical protein NTY29_07390, partial [Proteobacteria bacterium]|nr:hypothetical protein [Pseudomonadota bacterium]
NGESISARLVLVGTVHHDPHGYDKLQRLLAVVQPDIITLELSPYGRGFRTKHSRKLSQRILSRIPVVAGRDLLPAPLEQLLATIVFPFEYQAVRDYAASRSVPFYCIDLSHVSRRKVRMLKAEALTNHNIKMLLALPDKELQDSVNMCYKRAAAVWREHQGCQRLPYLAADPSAVERDEHMSRRLRNLCKQLPKKTIVHIAGWEHGANSSGPSNRDGLLRELCPRRILLDEAWSDNRLVPDAHGS